MMTAWHGLAAPMQRFGNESLQAEAEVRSGLVRRPPKAFRIKVAPRWVVKCLAPWSVGACLLVSFTASAGQQPDVLGLPRLASALDLGVITLRPPGALLPAAPRTPGYSGLREAPLSDVLGWIVPPSPGSLPAPGLRPFVFADQPELLPARLLQDRQVFDRDSVRMSGRFAPESRGGGTLNTPVSAAVPNASGGGTSPMTLSALTAATPQGTTPGVPRAVSLSSATPAPVEPQVIAMPQRAVSPAVVVATRNATGHTGYSDLIDPEDMNKEQRCLAEAVYFEARSEPPEGQAAVAQVVLNRVKSGLYPDSVCGVVYQNRHRYMACQFSFACEGKSLRVTEPGPWKQAVRVARAVTFGQTYLPKVGNATHYHANYVRPHWSRVFKKNDSIGRHVFYRPRPGQS